MELSNLPCGRSSCIGKSCGNFNDPESKFGNPNAPIGCKGGKYPPWSYARWYLTELPKRFQEKYNTKG